ncbi:MAG: Sec-independent protein translocase protein TatB [Pseudomonadota bacterium]
MFDIGFAELLIIAVVGLLVIGPERLPGAIRTGSAWVSRIRRGFNDIKREVQQELHNDGVMRDLNQAQSELKTEGEALRREVRRAQKQAERELDRDLLKESDEAPADAGDQGPGTSA